MQPTLMRLLAMLLLSTIVAAGPALARNVIFVDNARTAGQGTAESPFNTLGAAQAASALGDIIFVAAGNGPYEGGMMLKKGQMLIGSAFGLDAVRTEFHAEFNSPPLPAEQSGGPVIHGTIGLAGDNVVAGCTLIADQRVGTALSAQSPDGPIALRALFVKSSNTAYALYVGDNALPVTWTGGRIDASERGAGVLINGGSGNITFDHVAMEGEFNRAVEVRNRSGGEVLFHNASPVKVSAGSREGVVVTASRGSIRFDSPLQITTDGGRGFVINAVQKVGVTGGSSWIESTNGPALDLRDASLDIVFDHVSAQGVSPGQLIEGVIADKVRGRFEINGGTIASALSYGIRMTQSTDIRVHNLKIVGGGTVNAKEECPQNISQGTNLRCRAGLYLRHIERSTFDAIAIDANEGVGLNANNLTDVAFSDLQIHRSGSSAAEPAVLIDEARGTLAFKRSGFLDGAGGAVVIEQRFNNARVTFTGCDLGAPQRMTASPWLLRAHTTGLGRLRVELANSQLHDQSAGAISIEADDTSAVSVVFDDSTVQQISGRAIDLTARSSAHASLSMHRSRIYAAGGSDRIAVSIVAGSAAGDSAAVCADLSENQIVTGATTAQVRFAAASSRSTLGIVGVSNPDSNAVVDQLARTNGGVRTIIDSRSAVTAASACPD